MTAVVTEEQPAAEKPRRWTRRRKALGDDVAATAGRLQALFLAERPDAVSALARLRRGIGREPGFDYTLERYLEVPDDLLGARPDDDTEATAAEYAKHAAVTLYAVHQQSRREPMHVDGRGLGSAIAELTRASSSPDGIRRRFAALGTAATFDEALHYLRSLVVMLRDQRIPLDYGLLADDLKTLRTRDGRATMQATWGREFFRSKPSSTDQDTDTTEETKP
jgi:CRISPR system Cascade subunit CasB